MSSSSSRYFLPISATPACATRIGISRPVPNCWDWPVRGWNAAGRHTHAHVRDLLPGLLEGFFTQRLMHQRQASPHTVASYRDTFRLLLKFVHAHRGTPPSRLTLADLDAPDEGTDYAEILADLQVGDPKVH